MLVAISARLSSFLSGTEKLNYLPSHLILQCMTNARLQLQRRRLKVQLCLSSLPHSDRKRGRRLGKETQGSESQSDSVLIGKHLNSFIR